MREWYTAGNQETRAPLNESIDPDGMSRVEQRKHDHPANITPVEKLCELLPPPADAITSVSGTFPPCLRTEDRRPVLKK